MRSRRVVVEDLHKLGPGGREAVRGAWFDAAESEIVGLIGPHGAGKSTTLGVLSTMVRPNRGRAWVAGHDVRLDPLQVRRSIGVVFQACTLDALFTAREQLRLQGRLWRLTRGERERGIDALLDAVELSDRADDDVRTFSIGMRRRLELARALLPLPNVLLLDEPTAGIDAADRDVIWRLVGQRRREHGMTVIFATRDRDEAHVVCDRTVHMDRGRIVGDVQPHDRTMHDGGPRAVLVPAVRAVTS